MTRPGASSAGSDYRVLALISTAVAEMVVPILVGVYGFDRHLGTAPWGLVVGSVVGVVGGVAHLIVTARREERREEDKAAGA